MCRARQPFEGSLPYEYGYDKGMIDTLEIICDYIKTMEDFSREDFIDFLVNELNISKEEMVCL